MHNAVVQTGAANLHLILRGAVKDRVPSCPGTHGGRVEFKLHWYKTWYNPLGSEMYGIHKSIDNNNYDFPNLS